MFKQTIKYEDYDGVTRTEDFYFNLSRAELIRLQNTYPGGFGEYLQRIIDAADQEQVYKAFEDLVLLAYGEKSPDGKHFLKKAPDGHRLADDFATTEAYSELLVKMLTETDFVTSFVQGLMPASLMKEVEKSGGLEQAIEQAKASNAAS